MEEMSERDRSEVVDPADPAANPDVRRPVWRPREVDIWRERRERAGEGGVVVVGCGGVF